MQKWMTDKQIMFAILGILAFASGQQIVNVCI